VVSGEERGKEGGENESERASDREEQEGEVVTLDSRSEDCCRFGNSQCLGLERSKGLR
jgi:hypothetical protein